MSSRRSHCLLAAFILPLLGACSTFGPAADGAAGSDAADERRTATGGVTGDGYSRPARNPHGRLTLAPQAPFGPASITARPRHPAMTAEAHSEDDLWARLRRNLRLQEIEHGRIQAELRRYHNRQSFFSLIADNGEPYLHHIVDTIEARDLPGELAALAAVESAFQPFGYSHGRASGIWQFIPGTGRRYGLAQNWWYDGRRDVLESTRAALDYLEYLHDYFDGDWLLAMAAYNAGEGTVRYAMRRNERRDRPTDYWHLDLPAQTMAYVPRILAVSKVLAAPEHHGVALREIPNRPALEVVELDGQIDLARAAELADLPVRTIYRYNPALNRWATPPDGPHRLLLPAERAEDFRTALAGLDPGERVRWTRHRVQRGETLIDIAQRYNTTVDALQRINRISGSIIRAGEHLLVATASNPESAYTLSQRNRLHATQSQGEPGRERIDYRVQPGDSLWRIAQQHGVSVRKLASWNGMAPADTLRPGQTLAIWIDGGTAVSLARPENRIQRVRYTVRPGDSLYTIGRRFNVHFAKIARWNGIDSGQYLQPGQQLTLRVDVTEQAGAR